MVNRQNYELSEAECGKLKTQLVRDGFQRKAAKGTCLEVYRHPKTRNLFRVWHKKGTTFGGGDPRGIPVSPPTSTEEGEEGVDAEAAAGEPAFWSKGGSGDQAGGTISTPHVISRSGSKNADVGAAFPRKSRPTNSNVSPVLFPSKTSEQKELGTNGVDEEHELEIPPPPPPPPVTFYNAFNPGASPPPTAARGGSKRKFSSPQTSSCQPRFIVQMIFREKLRGGALLRRVLGGMTTGDHDEHAGSDSGAGGGGLAGDHSVGETSYSVVTVRDKEGFDIAVYSGKEAAEVGSSFVCSSSSLSINCPLRLVRRGFRAFHFPR